MSRQRRCTTQSPLGLVAQIIAPGGDFRWLSEIEKELALVKRPRSKFDRFVLAEVLIRAGLTLMHEAELSQTMTDLGRACQFRNGLMIAMLGFCPIRRKNFSALEIGRSFVKIRDNWWIVLSASDTKEKRADERRVHEVLAPFIDRYLSHYRPVLARSDNKVSALWLSANDGTPITANHVTDLINAATLATVGVAVSPHLFRTAVASTAAIYGGENPHLGSALLHHTDSNLINEHYNRASSLSAAENFRQIVRQSQYTRVIAFLNALTKLQKAAFVLFLCSSLVLQPGANNDARKVSPISSCTPAPLVVLLQMLARSDPSSGGVAI